MGRKRIPTSPASPFYGYSAEVIAEWTGVSVATAAQYKRGRRKPSTPVLRLFGLYKDKRVLSPEWSDYRSVKGKLWGPEGRGISPSDMGHYSIVWQRLAELNNEAYHELMEEFAKEA